jgi:hypothetical protein
MVVKVEYTEHIVLRSGLLCFTYGFGLSAATLNRNIVILQPLAGV